MRRVNNIFESEEYKGNGIRTLSDTTIALIILSALTIAAGIGIAANFDEVIAQIAVVIVCMLSSGLSIVFFILIVFCCLARLKAMIHRFLWR